MLKKLKKLLSSKPSGKTDMPADLQYERNGTAVSGEIHVAIAVLLVHIASTDDEVVREEAEAICTILEYNLGVPQEEIPALVEMAVVAKRTKGKIDDFTTLLNERFSPEQRIRVLAMIWKVVLADQKVEKFEERLIYKIRDYMKLLEAQGEQARKMAIDGKV